jgi:glycosyltransferase involved in cell wall biosynthesis
MTERADHRSNRPEVGYITRFLPSYRRAIMKALAKRLSGGLIIGSGQPLGSSSFDALVTGDHSDSQVIESVTLPNRWIRGEAIHWQAYSPLMRRAAAPKVLLIEESPRTLSLRPLLRQAQRRGIKTILWGHFSSIHRPFNSGGWQDKRRLKTAGLADALLTYTDASRERLQAVLPDAAIFTARNTLDTRTLFPLGDRLMAEGKASIRTRLGLADRPTLLFLGRLIAEKKPEQVVDIAAALGAAGLAVQVVMIGDGPQRSQVEIKAEALGVPLTMTGAISDLTDSAPWIAACDALVNPGYLGLSINHAFSMGVPVVAPAPGPDGIGHSQEWVFVQDGTNGRFADNDSTEALCAAVGEVLEDGMSYQQRVARFAREELSLEHMVDGMLSAILHVAPEVAVSGNSL